MKKNYVSTKNMSKLEWLKLRQEGVGSSDVGIILGVNKYKTPFELYHEKIADEPVQIEETEAMRFGILLEDVVAKRFSEMAEYKVKRDDKIRWHPDNRRIMCNIDRILFPKHRGEGFGILECKTASSKAVASWETEIPLSYLAQVYHQMYVSGFHWGYLAVLVDGRHLEYYRIEYDAEFYEKQCLPQIDAFLKAIDDLVPPPLEASDLAIVAPRQGSAIEADETAIELHSKLATLRSEISSLSDLKKDAEDKLKQFMGDNEALTSGGTVLATWKQDKPKEVIDKKILKATFPDVYTQVVSVEPGARRFIPKFTEGEE